MKHMRQRKGRRARFVTALVIFVFCGILAAAYGLPRVHEVLDAAATQSAGKGDVSDSGAEQEAGPLSGIWAGQDEPHAIYQVGVPFDLVGYPVGEEPDNCHFDWVGTMRLTVDAPRVHNSISEVGYAEEDADYFNALAEEHPDSKVITVDITIENIDAEMKQYEGGFARPILATSLFQLEASTAEYGGYAGRHLVYGPSHDVEEWPDEWNRGNVWVEKGETATIRMAYYVGHFEKVGKQIVGELDSQRWVDETSLNPYYVLVLNAPWRWGASFVDLGYAVPADGSSDS